MLTPYRPYMARLTKRMKDGKHMYDEIADFIGKRCVRPRCPVPTPFCSWLSAHVALSNFALYQRVRRCRASQLSHTLVRIAIAAQRAVLQFLLWFVALSHLLARRQERSSPRLTSAHARMARIKIEQSYAKELQNLVKSQKPCTDSGSVQSAEALLPPQPLLGAPCQFSRCLS